MPEQKLIFMVGPDRCGKTEISRELSLRTGIPYFKASTEHAAFLSRDNRSNLFLNQLRYADPRVFDLMKQTGHSVIFDRGFPCEWVYSSIFKRTTDVSVLLALDASWASIGAKIVFCYRDSYKGIIDNLDESIEETKLQQISTAYRQYAGTVTKCAHMFLNVDDENLDREVSDIIEFMSRDEK